MRESVIYSAIADLENLGEALLDFSELADLVTWLQAHS